MATKRAIGVMQQSALDRMHDAFESLAQKTGVPAPSIPAKGRDPEYLRAMQLTALAEWAEQLDKAIQPPQDGGEEPPLPVKRGRR